MAEDRRADGARREAHRVGRERRQHPGEVARVREEQLRKHQRCGGSVQKEVVPLDRGADCARDQGPAYLLSPQLVVLVMSVRGHGSTPPPPVPRTVPGSTQGRAFYSACVTSA